VFAGSLGSPLSGREVIYIFHNEKTQVQTSGFHEGLKTGFLHLKYEDIIYHLAKKG